MTSKKYQIKGACPQCGCTDVTVLSTEEMKEKYGDVPNIELDCSACTAKYNSEMKTACPEWDKDCKLEDG